MNPMDMPVQVPVDNPNEDTEWNDILRKHGVIPEKPPDPEPMIQEALVEARRLAHENRLEGKNLDELDELEDEEDDGFLDQYRQKRLNELNTISQKSVFNQVYPLQKVDYARDVTEASQNSFVCVLLTSSTGTNPESALLSRYWHQLAARFGDIKFCQIRANLCIEGYPDKNTPTVLIYKDGDIKKQIVTLRELSGMHTALEDLQRMLVSIGALKHNDSRLQQAEQEGPSEVRGSIRAGNTTNAQVDADDWD
ncbi:MAG: hypothetical protein Q9162_004435 [Coniocarpon cinnabarinum]